MSTFFTGVFVGVLFTAILVAVLLFIFYVARDKFPELTAFNARMKIRLEDNKFKPHWQAHRNEKFILTKVKKNLQQFEERKEEVHIVDTCNYLMMLWDLKTSRDQPNQ
jgi:hypothetical protein